MRREEGRTRYLYDTVVENLFIGEYMADIPGEYVKVYLYSIMEASRQVAVSAEEIGNALHLKKEEVEKAFSYFDSIGLSKMVEGNRVFLSMKEKLYGVKSKKEEKKRTEDPVLSDREHTRDMIRLIEETKSEMMTPVEFKAIEDVMKHYEATEDVVLAAYKHCHLKGKSNYKYVMAVIKDWTQRGMATKADVEKHFEETQERAQVYKRVMRALSFNRLATEMECAMIDSWVDQFNCSMSDILKACEKTSGISNPNINYVNAVIKGGKKRREGATKKSIQEYYEHLREQAVSRADENKQKVHERVPEIGRIDETLIQCKIDLSKAIVSAGGSGKKSVHEIRQRIEALGREKQELMAANNIPKDFMDIKYSCDCCKDTGVVDDGARCQCYTERRKEVEAIEVQQIEK